MVETVGGAEVEIRASLAELRRDLNLARAEVQKFSRNSSQDTRTFNTAIRGSTALVSRFVGAAVGIGAGVATFQSLRVGAQFEQQMSAVLAVTQATEGEFASLNKTARDLGAQTAFSASEAAEGMELLARAGFNTNEVISSIPGTLDLAAAGGLGLAQAADISSSALRGFGLATNQAGRIADVFALAASRSNTDVSQLGEAMKFVAPVAAGLGISLEEATAAVGKLSDAGLQGSLAGTGLRRVLSELASPSEELRGLMGGLTLEVDGLQAILQRLSEQGISTGTALELFGDRGGPALQVLTEQIRNVGTDGVNGLQRLQQELEKSSGFAERTAKTRLDNLGGSLEELSGAFEELQLVAGDSGALNAFRENVDSLTDVLRSDDARQFAADLGSGLAASVNFLKEIVTLLGTIGNLAGEIGSLGASQNDPNVGRDRFGGRRFQNGFAADVGTFTQDALGITVLREAGRRLNSRGRDRAGARQAESLSSEAQENLTNQVRGILADPDKLREQLPLVKELIEKYDFLREAGLSVLREGEPVSDSVEKVGDAAETTTVKVRELTEEEKRLAEQRDRAQSEIAQEVESLRGLAEQYLSGTIAVSDLSNEMEVLQTLSRLQLSLDDAQGKVIANLTRERQKLNQAIEVQRNIDEVEQEVEILRELGQMYSNAAISARQLATEEEILRRTRELNLEAGSEEASALAEAIRERDLLSNSIDREVQVRNSLAEVRSRTADLQQEIQFFGMTTGAIEAYRLEQQLLNDAIAQFGEVTPEQAAEIRSVAQAYGEAVNNLQTFRETTAFFESALGDSLTDLILDGKSLGDVFANLTKRIAEAALQATLFGQGPLAGLLGGGSFGAGGGGLIGGLLGGIFHSGGVVGETGARRAVSPSLFIGAPRLHNGLRPDEFPAILQRGEEVIPRGGRNSGSSVVVNMNISTPNADTFQRDQGQIMARTAAALERASRRNN